ncbi:MAG: glycosyltransferase [Acidobacteriota bacterium]|nr:glycosyltransferase [Acidobacteriota bacterium]
MIHSWLYDANIVSRLAKLFYPCKAPILTSLQCPDYDPETIKSSNWNSKKILALKLIDKITAVLTNPYFVACSYSTKDSYQKHYGLRKEKAVVIYNSYDETRLKTCAEEIQKLREEIRLAQESFVFLSVGRLSPQKNHENLIKAFAKLLEQTDKRKLVLLIAGVGNLEENLKELTKGLGIEEKVLFLGRRSDIGALLEIADVFVFPSFFEGLPIALIEAMSKGVPCVVSRISVFEEIVEDGKSAIFVDPNSPEEIKEAMLKLYLDEKLRESLGREAFKVVTEKFGDNLIKEWIDLYSRIKCES